MCAAAVSEQQEDPDGIGFRAGFRGDVGEPDFEHHLHLQQGPQVACAAGRRGPPSAPSPTKGAFGGCGPPDGEEILGVFGVFFWGGYSPHFGFLQDADNPLDSVHGHTLLEAAEPCGVGSPPCHKCPSHGVSLGTPWERSFLP